MATPTIVYCDPSIDADTGNGTLGSPYGRYGYMLSTMTFDTTNGNFLAIKQGTTIVGADWAMPAGTNSLAQLSHVVWDGVNPFVAADDISLLTPPVFDGNNTNTPIFDHWGGNNHQKQWINWYGFGFTNAGTAYLVEAYGNMNFVGCGFYGTAGGGVVPVGGNLSVDSCYFGNVGGLTALGLTNGHAINNYFYGSSGGSTTALTVSSGGSVVGNIFDINGTVAIALNGNVNRKLIQNNTIVQRTKGTIRDGIWFGTTVAVSTSVVKNNVFVGLQAALDGWLGTYDLPNFQGNSFYDCTANLSAIDAILCGNSPSIGHQNNEVLEEDPLARVGSRPTSITTMSNRFAYYRTKDIGRLISGGHPFGSSQYRGAVPPAAGGGSSIYPFAAQPTNWRGND